MLKDQYPLGQRCSGQAASNAPSLAMSQWHFPAAQQLQPTHTTKLCVIWGWAMPTSTAHTSGPSEGWASWHPQCEPQHQHCPGLVSTSIDWVQPRVVFFLILTNQLITVQNNILRLGKSFWLWKILKFILVLLAQTTWRLSAKLHKTN